MNKKPLILVVEDDPSSLMLATTALEAGGFAVDGAGSAEQAREVIAKRKPALILMDIGLPGMDGLDFTRELRSKARTADIPIVALTANALRPQHNRACALDCYFATDITDVNGPFVPCSRSCVK